MRSKWSSGQWPAPASWAGLDSRFRGNDLGVAGFWRTDDSEWG